MPRISIVTVTYNCESTIRSTVLSVLSQNFEDIDYVIIDGKSTDSTLSIIKELNVNGIINVMSKKDHGIFDAMNKALNSINGDWVVFINSGDTFERNTVLSDVFSNNYDSSIGVIYGNVMTSLNGKLFYHKNNPFYKNTRKICEMGICHQSIFLRSDLAHQYRFDTSFKYAADYNMIRKIYNDGWHFLYVETNIAVYDLGGISTTNRIAQFKEEARICEMYGSWYYYMQLFRLFIKIEMQNLKSMIKVHLI